MAYEKNMRIKKGGREREGEKGKLLYSTCSVIILQKVFSSQVRLINILSLLAEVLGSRKQPQRKHTQKKKEREKEIGFRKRKK